jgi:hypothetical protein
MRQRRGVQIPPDLPPPGEMLPHQRVELIVVMAHEKVHKLAFPGRTTAGRGNNLPCPRHSPEFASKFMLSCVAGTVSCHESL